MTKPNKVVMERLFLIRGILKTISSNNLTNIHDYIESGYDPELTSFASYGAKYDILSVNRRVLNGQIITETHLKCDGSFLFSLGTRNYLRSLQYGVATAIAGPSVTCTVRALDDDHVELIYIELTSVSKKA